MALFFLVATAIYGGLHAYLWWRTSRQLGLRGHASLALAAVFLALVALPFLGRLLEDGSVLLGAVELLAFLWMGAAFYLLTLNVAADAWNLLASGLRRAWPASPLPLLGGPRLFAAVAGATVLIVAYAATEAAAVRVRRVEVPTAKLRPGSPPLRIAQVSDVHLGLLVGRRRLSGMLDRVREARPDLLVCTGDLLDAVGDRLEPLAAQLREIRPPLGKYAVTGNHEYYSGIPGALAFLGSAGFRVLRDETAVVAGRLNLIGVEYRAGRTFPGALAHPRPLADLAAEADPGLFTLVLKHLPTGLDGDLAPLGLDLQLSGHTHDGQLFPFRWVVGRFFPHLAGLYRSGASLLYVSRGTGTWGPPLRFLAPPEVTLVLLVPAGGPIPDPPPRTTS